MKPYTNSSRAANNSQNERNIGHGQDTHLSNPMVIKTTAANNSNDG
jgi:hypothetical protein